MNVIGKILRGDNIRRSRFHTESGNNCGVSALLDILPALASWLRYKMTGQYLVQPWWVYKAIREVGRSVRPTDRVLEVGSGYSTLWLAKRCKHVCTIESGEFWARAVSEQARGRGVTNMEMLIGDSRSLFNQQLGCSEWDVVVIDSLLDRHAMFKDLIDGKTEPRLIIYDDTDKPENGAAVANKIGDYTCDRYRGFKPHTLHVCETTVFRRGSNDK